MQLWGAILCQLSHAATVLSGVTICGGGGGGGRGGVGLGLCTFQLCEAMLYILLETVLAEGVKGGSCSVAYSGILPACEGSLASAGCSC